MKQDLENAVSIADFWMWCEQAFLKAEGKHRSLESNLG